MRVKFWKSPLFRSIMRSYLIVCGIVLLATMAGYLAYFGYLRGEIAENAAKEARLAATRFEERVSGFRSALDDISRNDKLAKVLDYAEDDFSALEILDLKDVLRETAPQNARDAIIYFENSGSLLSLQTRRWSSEFLPLFCGSYGLDLDGLGEILDFDGVYGNHLFEDGRFWIMRIVHDKHYRRKAVLMLEIGIDKVLYADGKSLVVVDGEGVPAYANNVDLEAFSLEMERDGDGVVEAGGYAYVARTIGGLPGWTCYVGIPETALYKPLFIFLLIAGLEVVGAALFMLVMSFMAAGRMFKSIDELTTIIDEKHDAGFMETFDAVTAKVGELLAENVAMQKDGERLSDYADKERMRGVLDGRVFDEEEVRAAAASFTGMSAGDGFLMLLIRKKRDAGGNVNLATFMLKNVSEELLERDVAIMSHEGNYVALLRLLGNGDAELVAERLAKLLEFFADSMHEPLYLMMGEPESDFARLREIYDGLVRELDYQIFWREHGASSEVWHSLGADAEEPEPRFANYANDARKLLNALETGNFKEVRLMLREYANGFPRDRRYLKQAMNRSYAMALLLATSISSRLEKADRALLDELRVEERLLGADGVEELLAEGEAVLSAIIEYIEKNEKDGAPGWLESVLAYIDKHYTEQDLSVSGIADAYGFTTSHLSRTFKGVMGIGLLEYVHRLRVGRAKELLANGSTVGEAAVASGYLDAKALTRSFKKYEGITPGQYRDGLKGQVLGA